MEHPAKLSDQKVPFESCQLTPCLILSYYHASMLLLVALNEDRPKTLSGRTRDRPLFTPAPTSSTTRHTPTHFVSKESNHGLLRRHLRQDRPGRPDQTGRGPRGHPLRRRRGTAAVLRPVPADGTGLAADLDHQTGHLRHQP